MSRVVGGNNASRHNQTLGYLRGPTDRAPARGARQTRSPPRVRNSSYDSFLSPSASSAPNASISLSLVPSSWWMRVMSSRPSSGEVGLDARRTSCAAERLDGFYHGDVSVARNIDAIEDLSERVFLRPVSATSAVSSGQSAPRRGRC